MVDWWFSSMKLLKWIEIEWDIFLLIGFTLHSWMECCSSFCCSSNLHRLMFHMYLRFSTLCGAISLHKSLCCCVTSWFNKMYLTHISDTNRLNRNFPFYNFSVLFFSFLFLFSINERTIIDALSDWTKYICHTSNVSMFVPSIRIWYMRGEYTNNTLYEWIKHKL